MAIATGSSVSVVKNLPAGAVTNYTNVSLYVLNNNVTTRYNVTVVNATLSTAGSLTATGVVFATPGIHLCTFSSESTADLDTTGVVITPISSLNVTAATMDSTVIM